MRNERATIWKEEQGNEMTGLFVRGCLENVNFRICNLQNFFLKKQVENLQFAIFKKSNYFVRNNVFSYL